MRGACRHDIFVCSLQARQYRLTLSCSIKQQVAASSSAGFLVTTRGFSVEPDSEITASCSLRMFVAPPFAQQLTVLSRIVAFEAIECVFCRLNGRCVDLVFNCVDVHFGLFQTVQRFLRQWLSVGQSDCDLGKPTKLFSIARHLGNYPVLDLGIARIVDGKRWREPRRGNALGYVA